MEIPTVTTTEQWRSQLSQKNRDSYCHKILQTVTTVTKIDIPTDETTDQRRSKMSQQIEIPTIRDPYCHKNIDISTVKINGDPYCHNN